MGPILELTAGIILVLGAIAGIAWSKWFKEAKEAQISAVRETARTKDAEISVLREHLEMAKELTSTKLREHHLATKQGLEEYNDELKRELRELRDRLREQEGSGTYTAVKWMNAEEVYDEWYTDAGPRLDNAWSRVFESTEYGPFGTGNGKVDQKTSQAERERAEIDRALSVDRMVRTIVPDPKTGGK